MDDIEKKAYELLTAECDTDRHMIEIECAIAAIVAALRAAPAAAGVPDGWALVPKQFSIPAEAWDAAAFAYGGPATGEGEPHLDCTAWIGEVVGDDGERAHGLQISCDECPEEGSITLAEFPAAPKQRAAPAEQQDAGDADHIERRLTAAMREADSVFQRVGGSTRHHVRDCLLPILGKHGLAITALAASQPVGQEPVAWMTHHDEPMLYPTWAEAAAYCDDDEPPIPLYSAPPAQVDLEQFREALTSARAVWEDYADTWSQETQAHKSYAEKIAECDRLLALIDQQAGKENING